MLGFCRSSHTHMQFGRKEILTTLVQIAMYVLADADHSNNDME